MKHYTYVLIDPRPEHLGEVFYVGKGVNGRMYVHEKQALRKAHCNRHLQNKILKILSLGFKIVAQKIFEHEDEFPCHVVELEAIAFYGRENLCNLSNGGEGVWTGLSLSQEHKDKLSAALSGENSPWFGKEFSSQHRANLSAAFTGSNHPLFGKTLPTEWRMNLSKSKTGDKNPFFGKHHTKEHKTGVSLKLTGRIVSQETREKLSAALSGENNKTRGTTVPQERKDRIALAMTGKTHSLESRQKRSESVSGDKNPNSKLSNAQREEIKDLVKSRAKKQVEVARMFNVTIGTIQRVLHGRKSKLNGRTS